MTNLEILTTSTKIQASLEPCSLKEAFHTWLKGGNVQKYSSDVILKCIDKVSVYAVRTKISTVCLWEYTNPDAFKNVALKILSAKLFRIVKPNTYKVFLVAGHLYLRFLKKKPWVTADSTKTAMLSKGENSNETKYLQKDLSVQPQMVVNNSCETKIALNETDRCRARHIIASKFKNGYRISSNIDFERFTNFYTSDYDNEFSYEAAMLDSFLSSVAMVFDDRAYIFDEKTVASVRIYLEQMGSSCVHIDTFFEKFSMQLYECGIFSVNMLVGIQILEDYEEV